MEGTGCGNGLWQPRIPYHISSVKKMLLPSFSK